MTTTTSTTTSTVAIPRLPEANGATRKSTPAAVRDQRLRIVQMVMFTAGGVLMPFGIVAIGLGWYGTAHAHYAYDQATYLISGGILGLGLTFLGGFIYFGAWLAKIGSDQRDSARQVADAMLVLADLMSRQSANGAAVAYTESAPAAGNGDMLVVAGNGKTAHRRDCQLISRREDLHVITGSEPGLTACRLCKPAMV